MSVAADDIIRATVRLAHPVASSIQNVYHFLANGVGSADDADVLDAVETFLILIYEAWDALMDDETTLVDVLVNTLIFAVDHWTSGNNVGTLTDIGSFAPASPGDTLPPANTFLMRFPSFSPKHEGKKYFAPFTEGAVTDGLWVTSMTDIANIVALNTIQYSAAIPSSSLTLDWINLNATSETYTIPEVSIYSNRPAVQRRRKRFVGI